MHTPGPYWSKGDAILAKHENGVQCLARVYHYSAERTLEESDDNTRLFKTAPELLEALETLLAAKPQCECGPNSGCAMGAAREKARQAIAKATKETSQCQQS